MRTIDRATTFKRDYKRVKASPCRRKDVDPLVCAGAALPIADQDLPDQYRDHAPIGDRAGYRECHLKPDLLLIYRKPDAERLRLARLGSHSDLFG
jgi:mRNA interferase YafQ